jgi:hypothetical protein
MHYYMFAPVYDQDYEQDSCFLPSHPYKINNFDNKMCHTALICVIQCHTFLSTIPEKQLKQYVLMAAI